jgi:hypothetical protein
MRREARLALRPRPRLRCEEIEMPFYKATVGTLAGRIATLSCVLVNEDFATLESLGVRVLHAVVLLPRRQGGHAMFQSTQSTKTSIFSVIEA